jgi:hypothetical protein
MVESVRYGRFVHSEDADIASLYAIPPNALCRTPLRADFAVIFVLSIIVDSPFRFSECKSDSRSQMKISVENKYVLHIEEHVKLPFAVLHSLYST